MELRGSFGEPEMKTPDIQKYRELVEILLAKVNTAHRVEDIALVGKYQHEYDNIYDIIIHLAKMKALVILENELAYIHELRPNYRDGDNLNEYNNRLENIEIYTRADGYKHPKIWIIPNIMVREAYELDLESLKFSRGLSGGDREAQDLFYRYIAQSYGYHEETDVFEYIPVKKKYEKRGKLNILRDLGLEYYGKYIDMDYRDVRNWKLVELRNVFDDSQLKIGEPYDIRRLQFELELFTRVIDKKYWYNWTLGNIDNLLESRFDYIKYKENGVYIIFKARWLE